MASRPSFGQVALCRLHEDNPGIRCTEECPNLGIYLSADNQTIELRSNFDLLINFSLLENNAELHSSYPINDFKGMALTQRLFALHPTDESTSETHVLALRFDKAEGTF